MFYPVIIGVITASKSQFHNTLAVSLLKKIISDTLITTEHRNKE